MFCLTQMFDLMQQMTPWVGADSFVLTDQSVEEESMPPEMLTGI